MGKTVKGTIETLESRAQSGESIYKSALFYNDLGNLLDTSLTQFFNFVKDIPYKEDSDPNEIVSRPKWLLDKKLFPGLDCKKKATLMGAWFNAHGVPWRLVAISERPDKQIHHVFVQALLEGKWKNVDPTYSDFKLFEPKKAATYGEILTP